MALLTIGAFARASRLTSKTLRFYDEVGVLRPAAVDPDTAYRLYDPDQIPQARLIARLRGIGMPLAEIRTVCAMEPADAAAAVAAYWQRVATDTATRAQRAALLVEQLSPGGIMSETSTTLQVRVAAACEAGAVRESNQDSVYAGDGLLAVADGGGAGGAAASAAAIAALKPLEEADIVAADLLDALGRAIADADRAVRAGAVGSDQPISTLTAILRRGSRLALVHIGDTRAYLLRQGELHQLTQDHTWVQTQVDAGKLDSSEAASHPQRALLVRALGAGGPDVEADLAMRTAVAGDRYLLCSDGVSAVVGRADLYAALNDAADPHEAVRRLSDLAGAAGSPDNIACVVADFIGHQA